VNGVSKGHPVYNLYRSDIAGLFPGYANSNGAVGYLKLDTTGLTDGVHTIQWVVTDNQNHTDGIGSRYFSVQNSRISDPGTKTSQSRHLSLLNNLPADKNPNITVLKGHKEILDSSPKQKNTNGIEITIKELERVGIQFPTELTVKKGFIVAGERLLRLPVGSTLDLLNNRFLWSPGPGYVKQYRLAFIMQHTSGQLFKQFVTVTILPVGVN
jgi:hypothetical protein